MKFLSTFRLAGQEITLLHEEDGIYQYTDKMITSLMEDGKTNPVVDLCKLMFSFFLNDFLAGKKFSIVPARGAAVLRDVAHRLTYWVNIRSLKVKIEDIVVEDKVPVPINVFEGDFLSFNTSIEQHYDRPKKGKS